jgi:acetolactate synthase-1/2/3 large subunit
MITSFKTLSQELAHEFAEAGITDAFLVTGGAIAPLTTAIAEQGRIKMHYMLTEQSAGIAAEAYGYLDLKPALVIVTSGPGVTNTLTSVAASWTNSSPMIVVSGQARSSDVAMSKILTVRQVGNQHLRTDMLVDSIVKLFVELEAPCKSGPLVSSLLETATQERPGPVWLSIPQDLQRGPISTEILELKSPTYLSKYNSDDFKNLVLERLSISKSPAILVGAGSRYSFPEILNFAEKLHIPILTTWPAMDLIVDSHPLYCGRPGSIPSTWVPNFINTETDLLFIFGVRLDLGQVGYNPGFYAPNATVIRIDIDSAEFSRVPARENWHDICADAKDVAPHLGEIALRCGTIDLQTWWEQIYLWKNNSPRPIKIPQKFNDGVSSYKLISQTSRVFSNNIVVTGSSGTCMEMVLQAWEVQENQRITNSCGLGSMGFAVAAAIGIAAKSSLGEILCIESDGSLAMNLQDLATMAKMDSIFKLVIMDSSGYKSISLSQKRSGQFEHGSSLSTDLFLPDFQSIAEGLGFEVKCATMDSEIDSKLTWLKDSNSSAMLIVKVSSKEEALPRLISRPNAQGIMETPPMNDLWPLI